MYTINYSLLSEVSDVKEIIYEFLIMLSISIVAGGVIGIERQWRKKLVGVRTMILVSLGATIFVSLSPMFATDTSPTRIAAQVVSGIGFLAGGIILRDGFSVTGLNTAATLWCTAAVGAMIGANFVKEGFLASLAIMLVNIIIRFISYQFDQITEVYRTETEEEKSDNFLIVTGKKKSELALRTEIIKQLNCYYLSFFYFSCQELTEDLVQLHIEIEPDSNFDLAMKEITEHLIQNEEVLEVHQLSKEEEVW